MIGDWVKCRVETKGDGWWAMKYIAYRLWVFPILKASCRVRSSEAACQEALDCNEAVFPTKKRSISAQDRSSDPR